MTSSSSLTVTVIPSAFCTLSFAQLAFCCRVRPGYFCMHYPSSPDPKHSRPVPSCNTVVSEDPSCAVSVWAPSPFQKFQLLPGDRKFHPLSQDDCCLDARVLCTESSLVASRLRVTVFLSHRFNNLYGSPCSSCSVPQLLFRVVLRTSTPPELDVPGGP